MKKDTTLTEAELQQLRSNLQKVCGDQYSLQIIKTQRIGDIHLVVITYPEDAEDTFLDYRDEVPNSRYYFPYESSVGQLHYGNILPIVEKFKENLRVMYTCQDYFVFYTPFCTSMFEQYEKAAAKNEVVVDEAGTEATGAYHHYYGTCDYIKKLLQFITETPRLYF